MSVYYNVFFENINRLRSLHNLYSSIYFKTAFVSSISATLSSSTIETVLRWFVLIALRSVRSFSRNTTRSF